MIDCNEIPTESKTITVEFIECKDSDENNYSVVKIGNQTWMAENLKVTHYPDGNAILHITDNTAWANLGDNNTDDAYCFYNNDANLGYGALYTYAAAKDACPTAWHLPSDAEWTELSDFLGGTSIAGGKMKEIGTTHWVSPNTGADNSSGFSALPGGYRLSLNGSFSNVSRRGSWWSSTEGSSPKAYSRYLRYDSAGVTRNYGDKSYGFSVRCIRD